MLPVSVYVPVGILGYGVREESLRRVEALGPDVIAVDAGSSDPGPSYLGSGVSFTSRPMVKRDLHLLLPVAMALRAPLVIGTAGGSGAAPHVAWCLSILREVAREQGLHPRVAVITADIDPMDLKSRVEAGHVVPFEARHGLDAVTIDSCQHIVGQMGVEPIAQALDAGADVVLAGRALDPALGAALPLLRGVDPGIAYHMGLADCGLQPVVPPTTDGVLSSVHRDFFLIEPADPMRRSTPEAMATLSLYETSNPFLIAMPGGTLDLTKSTYAAVDERTVRVDGSEFARADRYTIKLEGAASVGFRTIAVSGVRDPGFIEHLDTTLEHVKEAVLQRYGASVDTAMTGVDLNFRVYGRDGVMGSLEPQPTNLGHEVGLIIEAVAPTPESAQVLCGIARTATLHADFPQRFTTAGNVAFPYSPAESPPQEVFEFRIHHLLEVQDPCELFPITWELL